VKKYLGKLILEKDYRDRLRLINELDFESYLRSVIPSEMPHDWPLEALKAQAVVSRTYAMYDFKGSTGFMESSVLDQVYKGKSWQRPSTDRAVLSTSGEVLTHQGQIFPAYFHAASGGVTTTIPYVWPKRKNFEAVTKIQDKYSKTSPYQSWTSELSQVKVSNALKEKGHDLGAVYSI